MMICLPPRDTSPRQDSAGTAPSGTPPPAQMPPPPLTRGVQSHPAPIPLKRPMVDRQTHTEGAPTVLQMDFSHGRVCSLRVEYAERSQQDGILFTFSLFCGYMNLEYVRIHVICRVDQAEYVIRVSCGCSTGIRAWLFNT